MNIRKRIDDARASSPKDTAPQCNCGFKASESITRVAIVGSGSIGAMALGAFALGAVAIGALSIGALAIGRAKIKNLVIDELSVRRLTVGVLQVLEHKDSHPANT